MIGGAAVCLRSPRSDMDSRCDDVDEVSVFQKAILHVSLPKGANVT